MSLGIKFRGFAWALDAGVQTEVDLHATAIDLAERVTATHKLRTRKGSEHIQPPMGDCIATQTHYRTTKQDQHGDS